MLFLVFYLLSHADQSYILAPKFPLCQFNIAHILNLENELSVCNPLHVNDHVSVLLVHTLLFKRSLHRDPENEVSPGAQVVIDPDTVQHHLSLPGINAVNFIEALLYPLVLIILANNVESV